ncbi:cas scaffolding protein family member 4 [Sorex fumeus]|uniref:cas scaffolding protein family member 4 n=1 Tax=Sorex fumeus TaxID=62283 RepID=UPI0024ACBC66|nr:cas scaffolding protein family member 4 [Sorex fumeus]
MDRAPQTLLARALYDNQADGPDELAFCRGDLLVVVAQDVAGAEGWWQCLLHGRPGLAPANRLRVLRNRQAPTTTAAEAAAGRPWARSLGGSEDTEHPYQIPAAGPVYEPMKSWVEGPPPPSAQMSVPPGPLAPGSTPGGAQGTTWNGGERTRVGARIVREQMGRLTQQVLVTIPRPARASLPMLTSEVPAGGWRLQGQTVPPAPTTVPRPGRYSTLPNPPKPEWAYDIPGPPQPTGARNRPVTALAETAGPPSAPRHTSSFLGPLSTKATSPSPHLPENVPPAKNFGEQGTRYRVPSSFQAPRVEAQNTQPNIYDLPRCQEGFLPPGREPRKTPGASEKCPELNPTWPGPEPDRASVSSSDGRASVTSSCSSVSTDSSSGCEDSARELPGDLSSAREVVTGLQQQVTGSVAGLMLFVSRTWRVRDHLEANIAAIRRAADGVEAALGEFLEFAQGVRQVAARHLADGVLQARIRDQVQTISDSYRVLQESKGALESFDWSLEVLATDKLQNHPDDLERFIAAARMVPEDIKRFASMVIANGRLLFGEHSEREEPEPSAPSAGQRLENLVLLLPRGTESPPRRAPSTEQRTAVQPPEIWKKRRQPSICHQRPGTVLPGSPRPQDAQKRVQLSEHCRLYFGALLKAVGVLGGSLQSGQPPEVFITQSKLVIMVGQKLVDTLCQETQDRDTRNEILGGSSRLCGQLRDVALATKRAVLQHPCKAARAHLLAQAQLLEQATQQFRASLE